MGRINSWNLSLTSERQHYSCRFFQILLQIGFAAYTLAGICNNDMYLFSFRPWRIFCQLCFPSLFFNYFKFFFFMAFLSHWLCINKERRQKKKKKKSIIRLIQVIKLNLLHLCCHVSLAFLKISIFFFELVRKFCLRSIKKMKTCKS